MHATVARLDVAVERPLGSHLSLNVAFDSTVQRGQLHGLQEAGSIVRHGAVIQLVAAPARNPR
jgi:hypothetical protein